MEGRAKGNRDSTLDPIPFRCERSARELRFRLREEGGVPVFIYCPTCETRFDVTDCGDSVRFLCDACGTEVEVRFANLVLMPGGIAAEVKEMGDGSRWLVCPKCGLSADVTRMTPGNRFRCRRCNLLLQVPGEVSSRPPLQTRKGDDILRCAGCKTRYDISRYSPGNRFRCRRCGLTLQVPSQGAWKKAGEWEIDVEKSLVKCNRCNQAYPLDAQAMEGAFVCGKCRRVFSGLRELVESGPAASAPDEEWEIDLENGQIVCPGCRYGYDLTGHPPGTDFVCRHCARVFRMPAEIRPDQALERREKIACTKCGASYDVSGYLRGTLFSCDRCQEVLNVGGQAISVPGHGREIAEPPVGRIHREKTVSFLAPAPLPPPAPEPPPATPAALAAPVSPAPAAVPEAPGALPLSVPPPAPTRAPEAPAPDPAAEPPPPDAVRAERDAAKAEAPGPGPAAAATRVEREPEPAPPEASVFPAEAAKPAPAPAPAPAAPPAPSDRKEAAGPRKETAVRKIPVPFPPLPPEMIPGQPEAAKKPPVVLVVHCTVCGTKHDAYGKAPGDKILCKCGKMIRIKGSKKSASPAPVPAPAPAPAPSPAAEAARAKTAEDEDLDIVLRRKTVRSEDVEVLKPDPQEKKKK